MQTLWPKTGQTFGIGHVQIMTMLCFIEPCKPTFQHNVDADSFYQLSFKRRREKPTVPL